MGRADARGLAAGGGTRARGPGLRAGLGGPPGPAGDGVRDARGEARTRAGCWPRSCARRSRPRRPRARSRAPWSSARSKGCAWRPARAGASTSGLRTAAAAAGRGRRGRPRGPAPAGRHARRAGGRAGRGLSGARRRRGPAAAGPGAGLRVDRPGALANRGRGRRRPAAGPARRRGGRARGGRRRPALRARPGPGRGRPGRGRRAARPRRPRQRGARRGRGRPAPARPPPALRRLSAGGSPRGAALLADHAFLAEGLLDLAEAAGEARWRDEAAALAEAALRRFGDPAGGFFEGEAAHEPLPARPRSAYDGQRPGRQRGAGRGAAAPGPGHRAAAVAPARAQHRGGLPGRPAARAAAASRRWRPWPASCSAAPRRPLPPVPSGSASAERRRATLGLAPPALDRAVRSRPGSRSTSRPVTASTATSRPRATCTGSA